MHWTGLLLAWGICALIWVIAQRNELRALRQWRTHYERLHRHISGVDDIYGRYHLQTFDGGRVWYAIEIQRDCAICIVGYAEDRFPGLLERLQESRIRMPETFLQA